MKTLSFFQFYFQGPEPFCTQDAKSCRPELRRNGPFSGGRKQRYIKVPKALQIIANFARFEVPEHYRQVLLLL